MIFFFFSTGERQKIFLHMEHYFKKPWDRIQTRYNLSSVDSLLPSFAALFYQYFFFVLDFGLGGFMHGEGGDASLYILYKLCAFLQLQINQKVLKNQINERSMQQLLEWLINK